MRYRTACGSKRVNAMKINHKDTKHTKAKDKNNVILVRLFSLLLLFPALRLRAFVVNFFALSEEAIDRV